MNKQTTNLLEQHFDTAFAAPDGIARLRELILTLAMQGKLVEQDPNDPPALELLKEIEAEKKRLVKAGKIKQPKPLPEVVDEEITNEIPASWAWVRFGDIAQHNSGKTLDKGRNTGEPRDYITTSNLYWGRFELDNVRQMLIRDDELEKCTAKKNDLLICEGGEAGRAAVWHFDSEVCFQNHVHRARFYKGIDPYFAYRFFEKLNATGEINQHRKGVGISNMSSKALASIVFPLPPLTEQHRIVARIDQLMARCEALEKLRKEREEKRLAVHAAAIKQLLDTPDDSAWNFIQQHFGELYTVKENVVELRKAIIQLAVMGRLSEQKVNDGPVSALLTNVYAERQRLKIRKTTDLINSPKPLGYEIPEQWGCVCLDDVLIFGPTNGFSPRAVDYETNIRSLTLSATTSGTFKGEYSKFIDADISNDSDLWLRDGDILVQRGNTIEYVGVPAVYRGNPGVYVYPDLMMKLRVSSHMDTDYVYYAMSSVPAREYLRAHASGTSGTMPKINQKTLKSLPIPVPPLEEQNRIVVKIKRLMDLCEILDHRIDAATNKQVELLNAMMAQV
jgi:type I restriction enzyme S subunit